MSYRPQQISELIRAELSPIILKEVEFPESVFVTITRVDVTPDLKHANIYVTILPDNRRGSAMELLKKSASHLRHSLDQTIQTRVSPMLSFKLDEKEIYQQEIDRLLIEVKKDLD